MTTRKWPASTLTLGDRETALKLSAYMIRRVEGSEDHADDQHDAAVWITLSVVKARAGWQPGPGLNLAPDHLCAVRQQVWENGAGPWLVRRSRQVEQGQL
jgi:hypothetical protein